MDASPWLLLNDDALLCTFAFFAMRSMIRISQVCQRFRMLALSTPGLWWDNEYNEQHPQRLARFIEVLLRSTRTEDSPVLMHITARQTSEEVLSAVVAQAHRVVFVHLAVSAFNVHAIVKLLLDGTVTRLESLELERANSYTIRGPDVRLCLAKAPSLRYMIIPEELIHVLPILESVKEVDVTIRETKRPVLALLFERFPHLRRLVLRTTHLQSILHGESIRNAEICPVGIEYLCKLDTLHIEWMPHRQSCLTYDIEALIRSPIKRVELAFATGYRDYPSQRAVRRAIQKLPGPWSLAVRDKPGTCNVCIAIPDGRERVWSLPRAGDALEAAIRPLLLDTRTEEFVLDGPSVCGVAYSGTEVPNAMDALSHVRTLRVVLPFRLPYRTLPLGALHTVALQAQPRCRAYVNASVVKELLELLPSQEDVAYTLELCDVYIPEGPHHIPCTLKTTYTKTT